MAAGKTFPTALLLPTLFLIPLILLYFFTDGKATGTYLVSSFLLALALALSSWGKGLAKGLEYIRILPLPADRGGLFRALKWAIAAFFLSCMATGAVSFALESLGILDSALVEKKLLTLPAMALILAFTLSPVAEEALFRGYFFRKISESSSGRGKKPGFAALAAGAVLSSLLFATLHYSYGSIAEIAVAFFVGLALCFATYKSRSLLPAVLAHSAFNFLSILLAVFL